MKINEGLSVWLVGEALGYAIVALAAGCLVSLLHDAAGALAISSNVIVPHSGYLDIYFNCDTLYIIYLNFFI